MLERLASLVRRIASAFDYLACAGCGRSLIFTTSTAYRDDLYCRNCVTFDIASARERWKGSR